MCTEMGGVRAYCETRRVWRVRRDKTLLETGSAAVWLLAEGDVGVTEEEASWLCTVRQAEVVRRAIEEKRCSEQVVELSHEDVHNGLDLGVASGELAPDPYRADVGETMRVWTDGACIDNGKPDAIAGWGVFFGEGDPRNKHEPLLGVTQTNQRAEIMAVIYVLEYFDKKLITPPLR